MSRNSTDSDYRDGQVNQGYQRPKVQAGSVTFVQRFGGSLNVNLHYHFVFLEGVYLDRCAQGLKPKFVKLDPPSDTDIAHVVHQISQRVIRKLCKLGYLESAIDATVSTGYDPLVDEEPELARTLAASVQQHIAFGERAGEKVRRIGTGFGYEGESPMLTGPRCASMHGFSLHANTHIPAHRRDQFWSGSFAIPQGVLSLWSVLRKMPMAISSTLSRAPGPMARGASSCRRWNG